MKNKIAAYASKNKPALRQRSGLLVFVLLFAAVGTYALIRSLAATGNDLIVTNVTMNPANPAVGQTVTFSATVKNQGTTPTTAGTVLGASFSVDGQRVTWNETNTASLAAGASVTLTANAGTAGSTWTATNGPHTVIATADDTNAIPDEADEANNTRSLPFTVGNTGQLYLSPSSSSVLINNNISVDLRLRPDTTVDGVEATLTYDATKLQFVSIDMTGSPFDQPLAQNTGSGTISFARGNLSGGVSTDVFVARATFKALGSSGTTTVQTSGNASKAGSYTNPVTANATVSFTVPDTTAPTASLTAPTSNAILSGTQETVSANASDNIGVTKVEFYVDGQLKGTDTTSPYSISLNTTTLSNASHSIQAKAYDAANNVGSSPTVNVTVRNLSEDINQDGKVDLLDFSLLASKYGQTGASLGRADINGDQKVNLLDFSLLAGKYGQ